MRRRLLKEGIDALPKSWRRNWIIQRIRATPPWADFRRIKAIYKEAEDLSLMTGRKYVVDHIIPLNHPRVCGLHNHFNLRPITYEENDRKGNYFCPEQLELFPSCGQLELI